MSPPFPKGKKVEIRYVQLWNVAYDKLHCNLKTNVVEIVY